MDIGEKRTRIQADKEGEFLCESPFDTVHLSVIPFRDEGLFNRKDAKTLRTQNS